MKTFWSNDWGTYRKGDNFTYETKGIEITSTINYVAQNKYYSLFVLENGHEQVMYSKLWNKLNKNNN